MASSAILGRSGRACPLAGAPWMTPSPSAKPYSKRPKFDRRPSRHMRNRAGRRSPAAGGRVMPSRSRRNHPGSRGLRPAMAGRKYVHHTGRTITTDSPFRHIQSPACSCPPGDWRMVRTVVNA